MVNRTLSIQEMIDEKKAMELAAELQQIFSNMQGRHGNGIFMAALGLAAGRHADIMGGSAALYLGAEICGMDPEVLRAQLRGAARSQRH